MIAVETKKEVKKSRSLLRTSYQQRRVKSCDIFCSLRWSQLQCWCQWNLKTTKNAQEGENEEKEGDCGIVEEVINLPLKNRSNFVYSFFWMGSLTWWKKGERILMSRRKFCFCEISEKKIDVIWSKICFGEEDNFKILVVDSFRFQRIYRKICFHKNIGKTFHKRISSSFLG